MSRELNPQEEKLIDERYAQFRKKHGELREERRATVVQNHCGLRLQRRAGESMKNVRKDENPGTPQP